ncbi:hypothetical protein C7H19_19390 [Aphanothece hegewaldii CCALA 016]|uniref:Uncharacterized protein n=1 Tax=Aphanothece hegewaldii CCALA 016 TaxID=2107694 RepID=A0A2T1LTC4_9CHRO|nr:hypothetical protein [Aphanothece hegewaldii]PSF33889.1 hypothetical protein C7H19_19390 [Aphanothece hegewaldii CCALA 016]
MNDLLRELASYGVNIYDPSLRQLCYEYINDYERIKKAVEALKEALEQNRVQNPTAFIKAAIRNGYEPYDSSAA